MTQDTKTASVKRVASTVIKSPEDTSEGSKKSVSTATMSNTSSEMHQVGSTSHSIGGKSSSLPTQPSDANTQDIDKLIKGANYVADRVKLTLGGSGASAAIESPLPPYNRLIDDGRSVAEAIWLEDPIENMGANIMKEIAVQADKESADGTTTAVVIAQALINGARAENKTGVKTKRELEAILPSIIASIEAQKQEMTVDYIDKVALTSSNDPSLAATFKEIYQKIGKDGIIEFDNSHLPETLYEVIDGVRLRNAGWVGAYSSTEPGKAVFANPRILISKEKITSIDQLEGDRQHPGIAVLCADAGIHELVIYCDDIDLSVASQLARVHLSGGFKTLIIKSPVLWKDWLFEDFAKLTGSTPVDYANGKTFKNLKVEDLGTCEKIISTKDETRILGTKDITEHIEAIKEAGKADDQQLIRASWLGTKAAILKVGANSESELAHKRAKVQDAIGACRLALETGVVRGGGISLIGTPGQYPPYIHDALCAPYAQILENEGDEDYQIPENIVDATGVVKNSVKAAFSVAGTLLSTKVVIPIPQRIKDAAARQLASMPQ